MIRVNAFQGPYIIGAKMSKSCKNTKFESQIWKTTNQINTNKKPGVAILISQNVDFKVKGITSNKECHKNDLKASINPKYTILNLYAMNNITSKYMI